MRIHSINGNRSKPTAFETGQYDHSQNQKETPIRITMISTATAIIFWLLGMLPMRRTFEMYDEETKVVSPIAWVRTATLLWPLYTAYALCLKLFSSAPVEQEPGAPE